MNTNPIALQIEMARREVEESRAQIERFTRLHEIARARLEAFEMASKAFEGALSKGAARAQKPGAGSKSRAPSSDWVKTFQFLHLMWGDGPFGYDAIYDSATGSGVAVQRASLRTKMMNYANDGFFDRVGDGQFSFTSKGKKHFEIGVEAPKETEPRSVAAGGSETGLGGVRSASEGLG